MFFVYNLLLTVLAPIWAPWMWLRSMQRAEKPNWKERFGEYSFERRKDRKRIWIHAVSVGEVVAAIPILNELRKRLSDYEIVLSTTTSSGNRTARKQAGGLFDHLVYFPIDLARCQLTAMQRVQPAVVAVMETELWMNFLWAAKIFDAQTLLINGRISDRSYKRARFFKPFYRALLRLVDRCLMQSEVDVSRITALGAAKVEAIGNTKFDQAALEVEPRFEHWRNELGLPQDRPVVVVGSTRGEEEERFVLEALASAGPLSVVHAPRHIERAAALYELATEMGFAPSLRTMGGGSPFVILDTYGELDQVYAIADVVIIGGGFADFGGQNLIQPMAQGKPVLHGVHMQNFRQVSELARDAGATSACSSVGELGAALRALLADSASREQMGAAAKALVQQHVGASARYADAIVAEVQRFHEADALPS